MVNNITSKINSLSFLAKSATKTNIEEFLWLIKQVRKQLATEDGMVGTLKITGRLVEVPPTGEVIIVGDLHGDLKSLVHILEKSDFLGKIKKNRDVFLIFLGDYGDRGTKSPEVFYVVLKLKQMFPERVILMRGNHEGPTDLTVYPHDLPNQLISRFGKKGAEGYLKLRDLFNYLYIGVLIENRYILLHGGAPSKATSINDIAYAHKKHPQEIHLEEIIWNDPDPKIEGTRASHRGAGKLFGENITNNMLTMLKVKALIRGHQSCPYGYKITHNGKVLTLFSRKGAPYNNRYAAYLQLDINQKVKNTKRLLQSIHKF